MYQDERGKGSVIALLACALALTMVAMVVTQAKHISSITIVDNESSTSTRGLEWATKEAAVSKSPEAWKFMDFHREREQPLLLAVLEAHVECPTSVVMGEGFVLRVIYSIESYLTPKGEKLDEHLLDHIENTMMERVDEEVQSQCIASGISVKPEGFISTDSSHAAQWSIFPEKTGSVSIIIKSQRKRLEEHIEPDIDFVIPGDKTFSITVASPYRLWGYHESFKSVLGTIISIMTVWGTVKGLRTKQPNPADSYHPGSGFGSG